MGTIILLLQVGTALLAGTFLSMFMYERLHKPKANNAPVTDNNSSTLPKPPDERDQKTRETEDHSSRSNQMKSDEIGENLAGDGERGAPLSTRNEVRMSNGAANQQDPQSEKSLNQSGDSKLQPSDTPDPQAAQPQRLQALDTTLVEQQYRQKLDAALTEALNKFTTELKAVQDSYASLFQSLQTQSQQLDKRIEEMLTQNTSQVTARYNSNLQVLQESTQELQTMKGKYEELFTALTQQSQTLETRIEQVLKQNTTELLDRFTKNIQTVQDRTVQVEEEAENILRNKINDLLINFEQKLSSFLISSEQKSLEAVNLEVKSARELIDAYKKQQMGLVDENIVAVLERTLALVLRNKLNLKNQLDLVFDSLEKAKAEKFFV
jgi:ElaB/YqjD/DUF883 family membrane-anchored ribosome-binding protein